MRVALALGSGGARGYAHIGAVAEIKARGHTIAGISGASMGAVVGGLAALDRLDGFEEWVRGLNQRDVLRLLDVSFSGGGAIRANKIMAMISDLADGVRIEDLPVPFTAVATDLRARREVWFTRGPLDVAVRASFAIPSVITPAVVGGRLMVDGGVTNPVPLEPLATVDADVLIAVSLTGRRVGSRESTLRGSSDSRELWKNTGDGAVSGSGAGVAGSGLISSEADSGEAHGPGLFRLRRSAGGRDSRLSPLGLRLRTAAEDVRDTDLFRTLAARFGQDVEEWGTAETSGASEEVENAVDAGVGADTYGSLPGSLGIFDVVVQSIDTMEEMITAYRMAGSRPDVLVEIPADLCSAFDFHRASEMIAVGRDLTARALDAAGM